MPLLFPSSDVQTPDQVISQIPSSTSSSSPHFLTFFASIDPNTGESWCIDCRKAQPLIQQHLDESKSQLVFVGDRSQWKESPFREAFGISKIPTIVKLTNQSDVKEFEASSASKLVESDVYDEQKLKAFLGK